MTDAATSADVVVAGAGHNSLVTAAYLARAGHRCVVLDARPIPGGGAATEELLTPGYLIDSCSTGHTLIRVNPLLADDELGLHSDYGLRYVEPDPVAHVAFPDGEQLTMWMDIERTCSELARFSRDDAAAYRRLIADYHEVRAEVGGGRFQPPGLGPSLAQRLAGHPHASRWRKIAAMSAYDVVRHEFSDRHVRSFMLWMALQTFVPVGAPGTGSLAYSLIYGRQGRSWSIPIGGSGALTDALVRLIEEGGGRVLCDREVARLVLDDGHCVGVETTDGERYIARRAVVSTIHVKRLVEMAPARAWGEDFLYGVANYDPGLPGICGYYGTTRAPEFVMRDGGTRSAVSAGLAGWPEEIVRYCADVAAGRHVNETPWLLVATPTLADPSRAPAGHHTVKLLSPQTNRLPAGERDWDELKQRRLAQQLEALRRVAPGFTDDAILASTVRSPADFERFNAHMVDGAWHGGDRSLAQSGELRPVPGWAQYRMPIPGLYQTGGTTHPGGSITGAPGRNAAIVLLSDLGTSLEDVVGARRAIAGA